MKVLFVLPEFYPHSGGGIATYYQSLLPQLSRRGIQCEVLVGSGFVADHLRTSFQNIPVHYLLPELLNQYKKKFQKLDLLPELQNHLAASWALYKQANEGKGYNIIETVDWGLNYIPWVLNQDKPVITRLHGSCAQIESNDPRANFAFWGDLLQMIEAMTLPLSGKLLTHSQNNQHFWQDMLGQPVSYIPPIYAPTDVVPNLSSIPLSQPYALAVGRIQFWKGPEILCKALQNQDLGMPLYWIGRDTDYQKRGQSYSNYLAKTYPEIWGKKIIPLDAKPNTEVLEWMKGAQFGIVSSVWDMFNFTALEWISLEKPIICSSGAGVWDIVQSAGGSIFDPTKSEQLAVLLNEYKHKSKDDLLTVGRKMQMYLTEHLASEKLLSQNIALYEELISAPPSNNRINSVEGKYALLYPSAESGSRTATMEYWNLKEIMHYIGRRILKKIKL